MTVTKDSETIARLLRTRRSVRDFLDKEVPAALIDEILDDARWAPSWSNTQPYKIAIAQGDLKDRLKRELLARYDASINSHDADPVGKMGKMSDSDFNTQIEYPTELVPRRRATGFGLYTSLGIARGDTEARNRQMRRNFEFFGAPVVLFVFVHDALGVYSVFDAGIFLNSVMMSAHARGLGTCAQGSLATWASPIREAFDVTPDYKLICGLSLGWQSEHTVNAYNPDRVETEQLLIPPI